MFQKTLKTVLKISTIFAFVFVLFFAFDFTPVDGGNIAFAQTVDVGEGCPFGYTRNPADLSQAGSCNLITPSSQVSEFTKALVTFQTFLNNLLMPILMLIGGLLDNNFFFGAGMEERMREIWVPMRNLVNILFVVVLVGVALYNILGIGEEGSNYSLKSMLPKIIIGIIAINFSFLAIKVMLDGVTAITNSIFALPDAVNNTSEVIINAESDRDKEVVKRLCSTFSGKTVAQLEAQSQNIASQEVEIRSWVTAASQHGYNLTSVPGTVEGVQARIGELTGGVGVGDYNAIERKANSIRESNICTPSGELTVSGQIFFGNFASHNAALALAVNMSKVIFYEDLPAVDDVDSVEKITISVLFSILLYLIYVISFIALFIVLLARTVVLWIGIVLSPLLLLAIAVPVVKEKLGFIDDILDKMIQSAIAPISIALALTVGWIMLQAMQSVDTIGAGASIILWQNMDAGGIPVSRLSTPQDIIVAIGTVGVVWFGVFGAASKSIAGPVTDAIKSGVGRAAGFVATAPFKYTPFIPIKLGGPGSEPVNVSVADLSRISRDLSAQPGTSSGYEQLRGKLGLHGSATPAELRVAADGNSYEDFLRKFQLMRGNRDVGSEEAREAVEAALLKFGQQIKDRDSTLYDNMRKYSEIKGDDASAQSKRKTLFDREISPNLDRVLETTAGGATATGVAGGGAGGPSGGGGPGGGGGPAPLPPVTPKTTNPNERVSIDLKGGLQPKVDNYQKALKSGGAVDEKDTNTLLKEILTAQKESTKALSERELSVILPDLQARQAFQQHIMAKGDPNKSFQENFYDYQEENLGVQRPQAGGTPPGGGATGGGGTPPAPPAPPAGP